MADSKTLYVSPNSSGEKPKTVDETLQEMKTKIRQQTGLPEETSGVGAGMLFALSDPPLGTPVKRTVDPKPEPKPKPKRARPQSKPFDRDAEGVDFSGVGPNEVASMVKPLVYDQMVSDMVDKYGSTERVPVSVQDQLFDMISTANSINAVLKAQSMMNPNIYDAPNPEAYQDMVNADFNQYVNFPEQAGTREYYTLDDDDTDIEYHVFDREDGVNVVFAETPDGTMYNVTDTHGMDLE